jgi:hypothetical protein
MYLEILSLRNCERTSKIMKRVEQSTSIISKADFSSLFFMISLNPGILLQHSWNSISLLQSSTQDKVYPAITKSTS